MRKILAHYIFDGFSLQKNALLIVADDLSIVDIIPQSSDFKEQAGVEFYNGILCPGFINAHCHLELSHLENSIPQKTGLPDFISHIVQLRSHKQCSSSDMQNADDAMRANGIVAVGDISNTTDSFAFKAQSSIFYHTFIELFDLHGDSRPEYKKGKELFSAYPIKKRISLSPHAPYSCSKKLLAKIAEHAKEYKYPVSIHNQEHHSENDMFLSKQGALHSAIIEKRNIQDFSSSHTSSLQYALSYLLPVPHIVLVHNIYMSKADIQFLHQHRNPDSYTLVLCPLSNLYIENKLSPIELFLQHGMPIAFGTDSLASNTELSILKELICVQSHVPEYSLEGLLHAATYRGARALNLHTKLGSFKKGCKPGVLLLEHLDLQNLRLQEHTKIRVLV